MSVHTRRWTVAAVGALTGLAVGCSNVVHGADSLALALAVGAGAAAAMLAAVLTHPSFDRGAR